MKPASWRPSAQKNHWWTTLIVAVQRALYGKTAAQTIGPKQEPRIWKLGFQLNCDPFLGPARGPFLGGRKTQTGAAQYRQQGYRRWYMCFCQCKLAASHVQWYCLLHIFKISIYIYIYTFIFTRIHIYIYYIYSHIFHGLLVFFWNAYTYIHLHIYIYLFIIYLSIFIFIYQQYRSEFCLSGSLGWLTAGLFVWKIDIYPKLYNFDVEQWLLAV